MDLLKNLDLTPSSFPNQLQSPSAEDDVLSSAGRDQIAADEDEGEEHQDEIEWSEGDERHGRLSREGVRSSAAGAAEIQSGSGRFFLHHGFLGDDDFWELHDVGDRRGSILTEGRLERQFSISDLG